MPDFRRKHVKASFSSVKLCDIIYRLFGNKKKERERNRLLWKDHAWEKEEYRHPFSVAISRVAEYPDRGHSCHHCRETQKGVPWRWPGCSSRPTNIDFNVVLNCVQFCMYYSIRILYCACPRQSQVYQQISFFLYIYIYVVEFMKKN